MLSFRLCLSLLSLLQYILIFYHLLVQQFLSPKWFMSSVLHISAYYYIQSRTLQPSFYLVLQILTSILESWLCFTLWLFSLQTYSVGCTLYDHSRIISTFFFARELCFLFPSFCYDSYEPLCVHAKMEELCLEFITRICRQVTTNTYP